MKAPQLLELLAQINQDLRAIMPELWLASCAILLLVLSMVVKKPSRWPWVLALTMCLALLVYMLLEGGPDPQLLFFSHMSSGPLTHWVKVGLLSTYLLWLMALIIPFFAHVQGRVVLFRKAPQEDSYLLGAEYIGLSLAITTGAFLLISANSWLLAILCIELISLCSYALVSFKFTKEAYEAAVKYLLFGGMSTAIALYGLSLWYGSTGSLFLAESQLLHPDHPNFLISLMALTMLFSLFYFKLSIYPFQTWAPDVYQGAPLNWVALLSYLPKIATLVFLTRFLRSLGDAMDPGISWLVLVLGLGSLGSGIVGNFSALRQRDVRRLVAYAGIANAAFLLMAIMNWKDSFGVPMFYLVSLALGNLIVFVGMAFFVRKTQSFMVEKWAGLGREHPWHAAGLTLGLLSLIGLPPLAGFTAKFLIFTRLWDAFQNTGWSIYVYVLVAGLVFTLWSLFYLLKLPYFLFFKDKNLHEAEEGKVALRWDLAGILYMMVLVGLLLALFLSPGLLLDIFKNVSFV